MLYSCEASPGKPEKSDSCEAMCLYQRAALGYFSASGLEVTALKTATSACEGASLYEALLANCSAKSRQARSRCKVRDLAKAKKHTAMPRGIGIRAARRLVLSFIWQFLRLPPKHGPILFIIKTQWQGHLEAAKGVTGKSKDLPNNVRPSGNPAVEHWSELDKLWCLEMGSRAGILTHWRVQHRKEDR